MEQQAVKSMTNEQLIGACVWLDREQKKSRAMMNSYKAELQARGLAIMEDHNVKYVKFSLSRTKVYKDRVKQDMRRKADIAFREMESEMLKVIKQDEKSAAQLKEILAKAKERMMEDD